MSRGSTPTTSRFRIGLRCRSRTSTSIRRSPQSGGAAVTIDGNGRRGSLMRFPTGSAAIAATLSQRTNYGSFDR